MLLGTSLVMTLNLPPTGEEDGVDATRGPWGVSISGWVKEGGGASPAIIAIGAFNASDLLFINVTYSATGNYQMFVPENMSLLLMAYSINGKKCNGYDLHGYFPESANIVVNTTDVQQNFTVTECYEVILEGYDYKGEMISEENFTQTHWTTSSSDAIATAKSEYSIFSGVGNGMGFNAPCVMIPPNERTDIWLQWEHPGFGRVNLEMDNGSAGYGGPAQGAEVVQVNYDLARSINKRMNDKELDYSGQGYNLSPETNGFVTDSDSFLTNAVGSSGMARVGWADQCINASLWALEGLEMDRAVDDIEVNRKGNLTVQVVDKTGYPVPNANVSITQTSHDFLFGVFDHLGQVGEGVYQQLRDIGVNYATAGFYWHVTEPTPGNITWDIINNTIGVPRLVEMGFKVKAHALIYLIDLALPPYMNAGMSFTQLNQTVYDHVYTLVYGYRDLIDVWNVVNEAHGTGANYGLTREEMLQIIKTGVKAINDADPGSEIVVNNAFYWFAEQMAGGYLLFDDNYTMSIREYNDWLIAEGVDFDIVGQQMYDGGYASFFEEVGIGPGMPASTFEFSVLSEILDALEKYDKPIHITEQSVSGSWNYTADWPGAGYWHKKWDYATQADFLTYFYTLVFSKPSAEAITWWDLDDNISFMKDGALFDKDLQPKPIFYALADFIANHTTDEVGKTDETGNVTFRAYGGDYNVTISVPGGGIWQKQIHITEKKNHYINITDVPLGYLPDLLINNDFLEFWKQNLSDPDEPAKMSVDVYNLGNSITENIRVDATAHYVGNTSTFSKTEYIPKIDAGTMETVNFTWEPSFLSYIDYVKVEADPDDYHRELNESNNVGSYYMVHHPACLTGIVTDNLTSSPIAGANVSLIGQVNYYTTTDSEGNYSFNYIYAFDYDLKVTHKDYYPFVEQVELLGCIIMDPKNVQLDPLPGTIMGVVKDAYGIPLAGVSIELNGTVFNTVSNETGWYVLEEVPAGNYTADASYAGYRSNRTDVSVLRNRTVYMNFTFGHRHTHMSIMITVLDENNNPIEKASVYFDSYYDTTDTNGVCAFLGYSDDWPDNNTFTVKITAEGYQNLTVSQVILFNDTKTEYLEFVLKKIVPEVPVPVGSIRGYVLDADTDEPIEGATLEIQVVNITTTSNDVGWYSFSEVPVGMRDIQVSAEGYETQTFQVSVTDGSKVDFDIHLEKEGGGGEEDDEDEKSPLGLILAFVMIGILIVLAAIVLIALVLVKRIREEPPPEEDEDEEMEEIEDEDEEEVDLEQ
jgi:GH35 family endo-1,4-beta-xylanase